VRKCFSKNSKESIAQYQKELDFSKMIKINQIVQLLNVVESNNEFILDYPFVGTISFKEYTNKTPLNKASFLYRISCMKEVLKGLETLHSYNIVHYDIKPKNIVLNHDLNPIIIDTGNWQRMYKPINTNDQLHCFTVAFGSPEHFSKGIPVPQTDLYQVGLTLLYTLVSKDDYVIFQNGDCEINDLIRKIYAPDNISYDQLQLILKRAISSSIEDRWTHANEFSEALDTI
jgi:serine/threonine protein kinase